MRVRVGDITDRHPALACTQVVNDSFVTVPLESPLGDRAVHELTAGE